MRLRIASVLGAAFVALASTTPTREDKRQLPGLGQTTSNACRQAAQAQLAGQRIIQPSIAIKCLHSIPVDVENNVEYIDYIYPLISFQSNLAFVKNPPSEYMASTGRPGLDILGGLDRMKQKLKSGQYKSQYEFTVELEQLVEGARDGHFTLKMPLNEVFSFARSVQIISISLSKDGTELPRLYIRGDFSNSRAAGMENPSYIVKIDNMPAYEYLDNLTTIAGGTHDKDAGFNMLFPGLTKLAMGVELTDYFSMGSYYELPDESSVELANGTVFTFPNIAVMGYDIRTVTTPDDLHKLVELGITPRAGGGFFGGRKEKREKKMDIRDMEKRQRAWPQPVQQQALCPEQHGQNQRPDFWPKPFDQVMDKYAGGFFLEGEGYNDVAVLEINSFASPFLSGQYPGCNVQEMTEYHRFLKSFVTKFRQQGKKKLVIDLSVNGGGWEVTLTDTFDQLFPGKVPGFSYRVRATKAMEWILDATYDVTAQGKTLGGDSLLMDLHKNWPKSFGPVPINGDNFTDTVFRSTLDERHSMGLDDTALKDPLVDPKNIVIITDGACHSSCALIVGWFTREMGIRTVLFGGRPHTAPVQAIGGTKGGAVFPWDNYQIMTLIGQMATGTDGPPGANLPSTQNNGVVFTAPMVVGDQSINSMDIWHNFTVPVQFQWEAANCRLFYTEATWQNIDSMWKAAADVAWKGAKCAPGSTSNADGTMGDKVPAFKYAAIRPNEVFKKGSKRDVDPRAPRDVRHLQGRPASEIEKLVDQGPMLWINRQQRTKGVLGGLKIDPNLAPLEQAGATAQAAGRPAPAQS